MAKAKPRICEICGAEIRGKGHTVKIEGAELLVCYKCYQKYGRKKPGTWSPMPTGREPRRTYVPRARPKQTPRTQRPLYTEDIVEDYADRVREAIQRSGLSYEELSHKVGLSTNLIRRIAHGEYIPTISEAKKLERYFKIKLIERVEENVKEKATIPKDYEPTLGDVANIKIKKRKKK
ncbi:multiprotein bridging factor aMBF1 [Thermococcus argininiproducens]|uniref:Multiprotein bridging factor aMBF1 n=1 Tax=Thermococcus argininiproducens TaxID=2866384 RepID=A0A9E7M9B0_9EURY|nr:multiprotein bridging factor aMBF1 [Thermococcus argininiproducens]USG99312.1 multiprotein bridging factor aMBF1 [Thermococcus argininiproducens]